MNRKTGLVVVLALCSGFLFSAPPDSFEVTELYNVGHEVYSILVSPDDPGQIYVATNGSGILKSTNGGASWVSKNTGISDLRIYEMDFHPTNAAVLYAAAGKTSGGATDGFYRSTDSGESWQARKSGLPSNTYIFQLAVDQNNDQVLYAGTNGSGIYRTDNAGSSWTAVNSGVDAGTQIHAMLVHPTNSNIILAGSHDGKVYRSTNQGSSWTKVSIDNLSQWVLDIAFHTGSTGTWYIGTYGQGVLKSTDNGQTWQTMNTGLTDLKIYHLLYAHGMLLAGTEKKGLFCYTEGDGWVPWHSFTSVFSIDADPEDVTLFFIGTEDKIYRLHVIKSYGLDIQVNGSGSVSVNPEKADYSLNEEVEITAIPGSESTFSGWSGDANGSDNPLLLVMNSDKSITANFVSATHTLNIQVSGSGSATANPSKGSYTHNEQVEVTATPGSGHYFSGWGGDASGSDNPLLLVMDSDKSITAYFSQTQETVSDPSQPAGSATGKVGTSLSCTTGGSTSNIGSSVEYRFDWGDGSYSGWGGLSQSHIYTATGSYQVRAQARSQNNNSVVSGWSSSLTVAVSGYTLAVSISGSGSVVQDPQKDGYDQDESVQLTAQASTGSHFDRWGGDLSSTDNPVTVPMDGDKAVRAYFLPDETNGGNLISLQSPAGGESVEVGSDFGITWTSTGGIQTVDIILTRDGGSSYEYIAEGTEND
ncbi:hypothetical protein JW906_02110, partial [bacterium]|nr:hypothetical protein [bacterium]